VAVCDREISGRSTLMVGSLPSRSHLPASLFEIDSWFAQRRGEPSVVVGGKGGGR
jgi:hypothetical protein